MGLCRPAIRALCTWSPTKEQQGGLETVQKDQSVRVGETWAPAFSFICAQGQGHRQSLLPLWVLALHDNLRGVTQVW